MENEQQEEEEDDTKVISSLSELIYPQMHQQKQPETTEKSISENLIETTDEYDYGKEGLSEPIDIVTLPEENQQDVEHYEDNEINDLDSETFIPHETEQLLETEETHESYQEENSFSTETSAYVEEIVSSTSEEPKATEAHVEELDGWSEEFSSENPFQNVILQSIHFNPTENVPETTSTHSEENENVEETTEFIKPQESSALKEEKVQETSTEKVEIEVSTQREIPSTTTFKIETTEMPVEVTTQAIIEELTTRTASMEPHAEIATIIHNFIHDEKDVTTLPSVPPIADTRRELI